MLKTLTARTNHKWKQLEIEQTINEHTHHVNSDIESNKSLISIYESVNTEDVASINLNEDVDFIREHEAALVGEYDGDASYGAATYGGNLSESTERSDETRQYVRVLPQLQDVVVELEDVQVQNEMSLGSKLSTWWKSLTGSKKKTADIIRTIYGSKYSSNMITDEILDQKVDIYPITKHITLLKEFIEHSKLIISIFDGPEKSKDEVLEIFKRAEKKYKEFSLSEKKLKTVKMTLRQSKYLDPDFLMKEFVSVNNDATNISETVDVEYWDGNKNNAYDRYEHILAGNKYFTYEYDSQSEYGDVIDASFEVVRDVLDKHVGIKEGVDVSSDPDGDMQDATVDDLEFMEDEVEPAEEVKEEIEQYNIVQDGEHDEEDLLLELKKLKEKIW